MSEEIGKHKGAVETLLHEQKELSRILQIVNSQLEHHIKALDQAGVDTDQFIKEFQQQTQQKTTTGTKNSDRTNKTSRKEDLRTKSLKDNRVHVKTQIPQIIETKVPRAQVRAMKERWKITSKTTMIRDKRLQPPIEAKIK